MKHIVVTAYAISPYKGSEDGTAWNIVNQMSRFYDITVVTRKNNAQDIKRYYAENKKNDQLHFEYYDLPYLLRFWKKKSRGALVYFYMWQIGVAMFIKFSIKKIDLVHNLNFHNDWTPTFLWLINKPLIWGPIGHHPKIKSEFLKHYPIWETIKEQLKWFTKNIFWNLDPFHFIARRRASLILTINSQSPICANINPLKNKTFTAVGCEINNENFIKKEKGAFTVLSVGRLVSIKGFDLTIEAFTQFYKTLPNENKNIKLIIIGKGPLKNRLAQMIQEKKMDHVIQIIDSVPFSEMKHQYAQSDVFLFPSHEGAGMVIPEALSYGLPIICLDNEGPGEMTNDRIAYRIPNHEYSECVAQIKVSLEELYFNTSKRNSIGNQAIQFAKENFEWNSKGNQLHEMIENYAR